MANFSHIDQGSADWNVQLNQVLDTLSAFMKDSGWVELPLKNTGTLPGGTYLRFRVIGPFVAIRTQFVVPKEGTTNIGDIPTNTLNEGWRYFTGFSIIGIQGIQLFIDDQHELSVKVPAAAVGTQINCDMMIMSATN